MIEEVINNIIEAEQKADDIIKESQIKSKEMIANAKEQAAVLVDSEKKRILLENAKKENEAQAKAEEDARGEVEACEKQANDMVAKAKKNSDKAIKFIIGEMTTKYGK